MGKSVHESNLNNFMYFSFIVSAPERYTKPLATSKKQMKYQVLILLIFWSLSIFAQDPNPDLFQTWNLNFVQSSDLGTPYEVSEIEPEITPTLTILENYEFSGEGVCNTFNGIFTFENSDTLQTSEYSSTDNDCGVQVHNSFESEYFSFMQDGGFYEITEEGEGLVLTISNALFGLAIFRNFKLSTSDFDLSNIRIYPNPSSNLIFLKSENDLIEKIELINSIGQISKSFISDFKTLDVSDLSAGIYIMRIYADNGVLNEKIIKK